MKNNEILVRIFFLTISFSLFTQIKYPETAKVSFKMKYHDTIISDNYNWLSNNNSDEVKNWIHQQNKISKRYLNKLVNNSGAKRKIEAYKWHEMDYEKKMKFNVDKDFYYSIRYPGKNSLPNIYYKKGNNRSYEKLIGPRSISIKDQIIFKTLVPSADNRFLAYTYSRNGSDWKEIKIVGIKKRHFFKETITGIINPTITWYGQGFFYIKNRKDNSVSENEFPQVYYHKLGTHQSVDEKIFSVLHKDERLGLYGTPEQDLFIIKKSNHYRKQFSYYILKPNQEKKIFTPVLKNIKYDLIVAKYNRDTIISIGRLKKKKFLIKIPLKEPNNWQSISPSYKDAVFVDYEFTKDKIVSSFKTSSVFILAITDFKGKVLGELTIPNGLDVSNMFYNAIDDKFFFTVSSFTVPPVVCQLDLDKHTFEYLGKSEVTFKSKNYHFIKDKFKSKDGVEVPLFIVYKDSIKKNGKTPFLLNTYGGYGRISPSSFSSGIIHFIESGGAFAYVYIRGSGDFGYDWWQNGRRLKKINGINDFIYAADYLVNKGLTSKKKIGILGSSHGGMITAAALVKRPDLFGASVINVGALDMLTIGETRTGSAFININEFGTVKNNRDFKNIISYSPYHNIKSNVNYPSTLIITGTNDTRVVPSQSYKFAAKLQSNSKQKKPILLWVQDKTGHSGANKYNQIIEENAFIYDFLVQELKKN